MSWVRRHERQTATGKVATVRRHQRNVPGAGQETGITAPDGSAWLDGSADPPPRGDYPPGTSFFRDDDDVFAVHPDGSVHQAPSEPGPDAPEHQAFRDMQDEMRDRRALGEPEVSAAVPDTSPLGRVLGTDTQEGAERFARLSAYRDAGYTGPLDRDGNIPDPDDPANWESLRALAHMQSQRG